MMYFNSFFYFKLFLLLLYNNLKTEPLEKVAIDCYCVLDSHYYANMEMPNQKRGLLLYGPGGCGKTMFGRALAGSMKLPLMYLEATRILHQVKSQSEKRLRRLFEICKEKAPCVLFIG